jgi:hypothetical protein
MPQETATRLFILASFQYDTTAPWFLKVAAGRVDPAHLFLGHTGAAMHDDRGAGKLLLIGLNHLEVQRLLVLELVGAVAGANTRRQRIAAGLLQELDRLFRFSQATPPVPVTTDY